MIISDEYKKKLDKTAQDKIKSGNWAVSNNDTGQIAIYPSNYQAGGSVAKAPSISDDVAELAYRQKQQKQLELERAKKATLSNLSAEKVATEGQYNTALNDTATQADIALKNYYETRANEAQTNSGATNQTATSLEIAKQNNMSGLRTAKTNALNDISRRRTLAEQGYIDDLNSANNSIDIATMQNQIDLKREQEKNAITAEQNAADRELEQARMMAELGDYSGLEALGYDPTTIQQQNELKISQTNSENELNKAKLMADMGDFSGLEKLGYDTTQLKRQWNADLAKTNRTSTGGSTTSTTPTKVFEKALTMKEKIYPAEDIVNYILMQGLTDDEEFNLIDSLGYYETYRQMYGDETTQNSADEQMKKLINRFLP